MASILTPLASSLTTAAIPQLSSGDPPSAAFRSLSAGSRRRFPSSFSRSFTPSGPAQSSAYFRAPD